MLKRYSNHGTQLDRLLFKDSRRKKHVRITEAHFSTRCSIELQRPFLIKSTWSFVTFANSKISSAKNRAEMRGPLLDTLIDRQAVISFLASNQCANLSMHWTNKYKDNGSPCRRPRVGWMGFVASPFYKGLRKSQLMQFIIMLINMSIQQRSWFPWYNATPSGHRFFQVKFDQHSSLSPLPLSDRMQEFLTDDNIVNALSARNKACLSRCDDGFPNALESISDQFGDDLVNRIAQTDWSGLSEGGWVVGL